MLYTIDNYSNITFSGINYKLPEIQLSIIQKLIKDLNISTTNIVEDENEEKPKNQNSFSIKKYNTLSSYRNKNKIDESWKGVPEFKITKIEKSEGIDLIIKDIRVCLNKISNKNYDSQKELIIQFINSVNKNISKNNSIDNKENDNKDIKNPFNLLDEEDEENDEECSLDLKKVAQSIFDIASSNKFYSELYAELYKELIEKYIFFKDYIVNLLNDYYNSMDLIEIIDSNKDYDKYCENNKQNDKRKALSTFIINLMKKTVIMKKDVLHLIIKLQDKVMSLVDIDDKNGNVDEITENIYILITMINLKELNCKDLSDKIIENIEICSNYKVKDHKSISNRAIFKYMDILDIIKKQ
jgi:hypothetical protein